ncbi:hypothetical protein D3C71_2173940 [compost metagenome]
MIEISRRRATIVILIVLEIRNMAVSAKAATMTSPTLRTIDVTLNIVSTVPCP